MTKRISPCAECGRHLAGLSKDCEQCEKCWKRKLYVIESERAAMNQVDYYEEYNVNACLPKFNCG